MYFAFPPHLIPENVVKSGPTVTSQAELHFLFPSLLSKRSWTFYLINNNFFILPSGHVQISWQSCSCEGNHLFQCQPWAPLFLLQRSWKRVTTSVKHELHCKLVSLIHNYQMWTENACCHDNATVWMFEERDCQSKQAKGYFFKIYF